MSLAVRQYLLKLTTVGFKGDICQDIASRTVMATDNSVYQLMPQAVLYPKDYHDVEKIFQLASTTAFQHIKFSARGGGTGTNGQSLTTGIMINYTKYMNNIVDIDLTQETVTVQPGVVREQLNDYLKKYGYFFAPHLSTGSRATLGGMINTNACGKGSFIYGRTADHITALKAVMASGALLKTDNFEQDNNKIITSLNRLFEKNQKKITQSFPKLLRYMTGYDLIHAYQHNHINLNYLIAGSEGTLVNITKATLKITKLPQYKILFVLRHASFEEALSSADIINKTMPSAIEVIDETVVQYSQHDASFSLLSSYVLANDKLPGAINLVEYVAKNNDDLIEKIQSISALLDNNKTYCSLGYDVINEEALMSALWQLRKRSVEMIGKMPEARKPVSGIEDTVVDPSKLKDYMMALKKCLDRHQLKYAMYGHIDAGCIHVRPALDLTDPNDEKLYHTLSDEVAQLVKSFGGLIWGEHGKGFRSAYIRDFVGKELNQVFREIKSIFDPANRLNPGKIATPVDSKDKLLTITATKKAAYLRNISDKEKKHFDSALLCNGNAACFNYDPDVNICPSYKVTRDPIHSPKGRANLIIEWLIENASNTQNNTTETALFNALEGCLGCKACQTQCPVSVNIPSMKSKYYERYFQSHKRSLKQKLLLNGETINLALAKYPRASNLIIQSFISRWFLKQCGIKDIPPFAMPAWQKPTMNNSSKQVCLLIDWAYQCFAVDVVYQCINALQRLGYEVLIIDNFKHGKLLYNLGERKQFKKIAINNNMRLKKINEQGIPIIGIDPSLTMMFRDEYGEVISSKALCQVQLIQEFLAGVSSPAISSQNDIIISRHFEQNQESPEYYLFTHCYESAAIAQAQSLWQQVFDSFNLTLKVVQVGCCGMAGSYGHEKKHDENSKQLFEISWLKAIEHHGVTAKNMLVTGFSCREQVKRFCGFTPRHPIAIIADYD